MAPIPEWLVVMLASVALSACGEYSSTLVEPAVQSAKGGNPGKPGGGGGGGGDNPAGLSGSALDGIAGTFSRAQDINDAGYVLGFEDMADGRRRSFVWRDGAVAEVARTAVDAPERINNANVVLAFSYYLVPDGPMSWGSPIPLDLPSPQWTRPAALDIAGPNAAGVSWISGYGDDPSGEEAALRWRLENGVAIVEQIPIPASADPRAFYAGEGVNVHGHVVGEFRVQAGNAAWLSRAFVWFGDPTPPVLLPHPSGSSDSEAFAINDDGVVVGMAEVKGNKTVPVRWTPSPLGSANYGAPEVLPTPTREGSATAINNVGQIAGNLRDGSLYRGFLYDPAEGSAVVLEPVNGHERSGLGPVSLLVGGGGINCSGVAAGFSSTPAGTGQTGGSEGAATLWAGRDGGC